MLNTRACFALGVGSSTDASGWLPHDADVREGMAQTEGGRGARARAWEEFRA